MQCSAVLCIPNQVKNISIICWSQNSIPVHRLYFRTMQVLEKGSHSMKTTLYKQFDLFHFLTDAECIFLRRLLCHSTTKEISEAAPSTRKSTEEREWRRGEENRGEHVI